MGTIKIGVPVPMTGPLTAYGSDVLRGVKLAVRHINARGGVLGRMLEHRAYDDAGSAKQAVAAAYRLVQDGVKAAIGHPCSDCAHPAAAIYEDEGVLALLPAATSPDITGLGYGLVFRTVGTDVVQASVVCDWVAETTGPDAKIAIVHDKQMYGEGIATAVKSGLKDKGFEAVLFEGINAGERDFSSIIERLGTKDVDFVYYGGYYAELGRLLRQARAAGLKAKFIASDAAATSEVQTAARDAVEGLLVTSPRTFDELAQHKALTQEMADDDATGFTSPTCFTSYAAVEVFAQGIAAAGNCDDAEKIAQAIRAGTFDTTAGSLSFQPNGDLTCSEFVVEECHFGKPRTRAG